MGFHVNSAKHILLSKVLAVRWPQHPEAASTNFRLHFPISRREHISVNVEYTNLTL